MEIFWAILFWLSYGIGALFFWWIYPYTLSQIDFFEASPINYWIGRIVYALAGPPVSFFLLAMLYGQLFGASPS